jgi:F420H(2)-dependent quinone reductase
MPSRRFFKGWNRVVNPPVRLLLNSPAHRLASGSMALITVTGRRSGRSFTIPTSYRRDGERVTIAVAWPESKLWWRNLTGIGAPVELEIAGQHYRGQAIVHGDEASGVTVEVDQLLAE